jgi:hypothetical protein
MQDMIVGDVLLASDAIWGTQEVEGMSDEDLHILIGAATRIMLECGAEESRRRHGLAECDSMRLLQHSAVRQQIDRALSLLHVADVPRLPSVV